jgi:crossover junction endonuclease MUS81
MKACPLEFSHPSEAIQLNGLGPKLCDRLTEKLKEYCEQNGLPMPEPPSKIGANQKRQSGDDLPDQSQPTKKPRKVKPYIPALRSGAYALVLGLSTLDEDSPHGMTKAQLIDAAQQHSETSFTAPSDPTKFYTAWNSMKTLIQKELVYEHGRPLRKYALTEEGWECAKRIRNTSAVGLPVQNRVCQCIEHTFTIF